MNSSGSDEEDSDEENQSFLPGGSASSSSRRSKKKKKKKHYRSRRSSEDEESDQEPSRQPLAQSIHANREAQRLKLHPSMAGSNSTRSKSGDKRTTLDLDDKDKENAELKAKLACLQKRMKLERTGANFTGSASGTTKAMVREVSKMTKTNLWKICKFFKNDYKARFCFVCFGSCFYCANFCF